MENRDFERVGEIAEGVLEQFIQQDLDVWPIGIKEDDLEEVASRLEEALRREGFVLNGPGIRIQALREATSSDEFISDLKARVSLPETKAKQEEPDWSGST